MTLTVNTAIQAGQVAAQILIIQNLVNIVNNAITDGNWVISKLSATDSSGVEHPLITGNLDLATSQAALQYTMNVYSTMLSQLNTQLTSF